MHYICIIYVKKVEISDYIYKSNSILKLKGDVKEVFDKTFMKKKKILLQVFLYVILQSLFDSAFSTYVMYGYSLHM